MEKESRIVKESRVVMESRVVKERRRWGDEMVSEVSNPQALITSDRSFISHPPCSQQPDTAPQTRHHRHGTTDTD
jgi:hypothetical protein